MIVDEEVSDFDHRISKSHETAELIKQHTESSYLARIPRVPGLDFQIFEGKVEDDPKEWINKCDYFHQCGVSEAQKLGLATIHLRGEAGTWYLANQSKISNFKDLCDELCLNYEWMWVVNTNVLEKEKTVVQGICSTKPNDDSSESVSNFVNVLKEEIKPLVQKIKPWGVSLRKAVKIPKLDEICMRSKLDEVSERSVTRRRYTELLIDFVMFVLFIFLVDSLVRLEWNSACVFDVCTFPKLIYGF